jgi:hypothetical protein
LAERLRRRAKREHRVCRGSGRVAPVGAGKTAELAMGCRERRVQQDRRRCACSRQPVGLGDRGLPRERRIGATPELNARIVPPALKSRRHNSSLSQDYRSVTTAVVAARTRRRWSR